MRGRIRMGAEVGVKRALVLGGGGAVGVAWETGIACGLADAGIDLREADTIIGTSAGSIVGTHLAWRRDPREILVEVTASRPQADGSPVPREQADIVAIFQLWSSFEEMTPEACAKVGTLAMRARTVPQEQWLEGFARNGWPGWPERDLRICAVECESGERRVFTCADGVPIAQAVAASCAVPGLFPAVEIGGRRYTDGGVWSWTSADLALQAGAGRALVVAPAGDDGPGVRGLAARQLRAEERRLLEAGVDVRVVIFDDAAQKAGANLMDQAATPAAAEAGRVLGRRLAEEIGAWWEGG